MSRSATRMLPPASLQAGTGTVPRVLVIDDEDVARYLVIKLLSGLPAEVLEARAGAEGLQYAREHRSI